MTVRTKGRYALSLRVLVIAVLVLGGGFGWTANRLNSRRSAVEAVRKAKGSVSFDYQYVNGQPKPAGKPWPPVWLATVLPVEFFHDVTVVNNLNLAKSEEHDAKAAMAAIRGFDRLENLRIANPLPRTTISGLDRLTLLRVSLTRSYGDQPIRLGRLLSLREVYLDGPGVNDSLLSELAGLPSLREIRLQNTNVTDAGLSQLEGLSELEVLWVSHAHITDSGMASVVKLRKLAILDLIDDPRVTDEGVRFLASNLPGLKHLIVSRSSVTDAGLAHLQGFPALEGLQIQGQGRMITDAGMARLWGLAHLEVLNLSDSGVTDEGIAQLQGLKKLRWLNLSGTAVSDSGLRRLREIQSLRWLNLSGTHITDAGLLALTGLVDLEQLFLDETDVTDAGLKHLCGMKSLKVIVVGGANVSAEGVDELRTALPSSTRVRKGSTRVPSPACPLSRGPRNRENVQLTPFSLPNVQQKCNIWCQDRGMESYRVFSGPMGKCSRDGAIQVESPARHRTDAPRAFASRIFGAAGDPRHAVGASRPRGRVGGAS